MCFGTAMQTVNHSFINCMCLQFLQFLYLLLSYSNQLVDFRDLPIEKVHNLILLGAGRNRNVHVADVFEPNRLPNASSHAIKDFLNVIGMQ